jgi:insertion element IS1 protein InsB
VLPVSDTTAGAKRFINVVIGDRSNKTAKKFWKTIKHHESKIGGSLRAARIRHNCRSQMKYIASDYWKPYESIIPKESKIDGSEPTERIGHDCRSQKHIQTKAATFTVEGYNSLVRHFLARMKRKSKCYSKTMEMLNLSLLLLMHHRNQSLAIAY